MNDRLPNVSSDQVWLTSVVVVVVVRIVFDNVAAGLSRVVRILLVVDVVAVMVVWGRRCEYLDASGKPRRYQITQLQDRQVINHGLE